MKIGTKSVLFGAHCFFLHPWFVAAGWWKLYGFPWDPRLWFAFFLHDIGYLGKPNMDGKEGELHPTTGASILSFLFDWPKGNGNLRWYYFSLYHSRYLAKGHRMDVSKLCYADKLSIALTPSWIYLPMVRATGEIHEYLKMAKNADTAASRFKADDYRGREQVWHTELRRYMVAWVEAHKDGSSDTWTSENRHAKTESGVWQ